MLMLTRRSGSTILIGDDIKVVVGDISGTQVRIGVEAPRGIKVIRGELADRPHTPPDSTKDVDSHE